MTIERMQTEMTNTEYIAWRAFNVYRNAKLEQERKGGSHG